MSKILRVGVRKPCAPPIPTFKDESIRVGEVYWSRDWQGHWCQLLVEVDRGGEKVLVMEESGATVWWRRTALTSTRPESAEVALSAAKFRYRAGCAQARRLAVIERSVRDLTECLFGHRQRRRTTD